LQAREELISEKEYEPSDFEIAEKLGVPRENVTRAMEAIVEPMSIYEPLYSDGGDQLYVIDQLSDTASGDERWIESLSLKEALKCLDERETMIISMRYYQNKTQTEIAEVIGISQAQVSRIEKGAIEKMRKVMC
jgi:RNA polymerase sporulation-specific sigma factor